MHQVPTDVWNEIARSQPLSEPWATLFRMSPEEMPAGIEKMMDAPAEKAGADNRTVLAYRLTAPLLVENEAISAYLEETQQSSLRMSLPELTSVSEALILASTEYRLTQSQQAKLRSLLVQALQSSRALPSSAPPTS